MQCLCLRKSGLPREAKEATEEVIKHWRGGLGSELGKMGACAADQREERQSRGKGPI